MEEYKKYTIEEIEQKFKNAGIKLGREIKLEDHQRKILEEDKGTQLLQLGAGSGKTVIGLFLARGNTLVICEKDQVIDKKWETDKEIFEADHITMKVLSKEQFKKYRHELGGFDTIIIDEIHNFTGVSPDTFTRDGRETPKTSQLFSDLVSYIREYPPNRLIGASATPSSKPFHTYALYTIFGHDWDYFRYREKYYYPIKKGRRTVWTPKSNKELKDRQIELLKNLGPTGRLQNWFNVPEQKNKVIDIALTEEQQREIREAKQKISDPQVFRAFMRTVENGCAYKKGIVQIDGKTDTLVKIEHRYHSHKIDAILELAKENKKMLIFAMYTAQVHAIADALKEKGYNVFVRTGKTPDNERAEALRQAESLESAYLICQANMSAGFDFTTTRATVFASKSSRFLHYEQALGRNLRQSNWETADNTYYHLVVKGGADEKCHTNIMAGKDFQEKLYISADDLEELD